MKPNPLAEIDIVEVAKIAASIPTPGIHPFDKIREAYNLLTIAHEVKCEALRTGHRPLRVLKDWSEDLQPVPEDPIWIELDAITARRPDKDAPISLADCLKELMPQVEKTKERAKRFLDFLTAPKEENRAGGMSLAAAQKALARFKSKGIPWVDFTFYFVAFREWWPLQFAKQKSKAGKTKKSDEEACATQDGQAQGIDARKKFEKNKKTRLT